MTTANQATINDILHTADDLRWKIGGNFHENLMEAIYTDAAQIADRAVTRPDTPPRWFRRGPRSAQAADEEPAPQCEQPQHQQRPTDYRHGAKESLPDARGLFRRGIPLGDRRGSQGLCQRS